MRIVVPIQKRFAPFREVGIIIQIPIIRRHAVIAAQILGVQHFLAGQQRLVLLLPMPHTDQLDGIIGLKDTLERVRQRLDGGRGRLLHEEVARFAMLEGVEHQIHCICDAHHKAGHRGIGHGERLTGLDLLDKEGDDRAARGHDVAVARGADGAAALHRNPRLRHGQFLHHRFGNPHRVDGIRGLIRTQHDEAFDARRDCRVHHILRAYRIGEQRLHGIELARGHLLERRRVEDEIHARHGIQQARGPAHVPDGELDFGVVVRQPHIVLLLLVARKDADLADAGIEEAIQDGVAEGAGAAGDEKGLVSK